VSALGYGRPVRNALFALALLVALVSPAAADDGPRFHRTTPRGAFGTDGPALLIGVPGGRAWGIESELRTVPDERSSMRATIEIADPAVREAFVRIAWYDRMTGRPRQFALTDARFVVAGETVTLEVTLDPPPGAVAYRVRVLARLVAPSAVSMPEAIRVRLSPPAARPPLFPLTRLLP
jgi:hypothetical protein